uniref:Stabilizer of axonemal microtubules 1 n=1 Tax=Timema cristinae TaxID=61476 RepID=A0A7R9D0I9_TIMCR|nr:unnamed protein product [Timema cristinae]
MLLTTQFPNSVNPIPEGTPGDLAVKQDPRTLEFVDLIIEETLDMSPAEREHGSEDIKWPPEGKGKPCVCRKHLCCKMKYVQPERPKNFKPHRMYERPKEGLQGDTVYKICTSVPRRAYRGTQCTKCHILPHSKAAALKSRGIPHKAEHTLGPCGDFSGDTVHKMSYPGWPGVLPAQTIPPIQRSLLGEGPMQDVTTQRHDYRPKPFSRSEPFKPPGQIVTSDKPLDDLTTMLASYQPPRRVAQPVSFKPERYYKKPCDTIDDKTVHKMSYVPWPVKDKECMPWAEKQKYRHPCQPMDGNTVYNTSYLPTGGYSRRQPLKLRESPNLLGGTRKFDDSTVYKRSYFPVKDAYKHRPEAVKASDNIYISPSKMDPNTIHKMSYPGWPGVLPAQTIPPIQRSLLGEGPMQDITTQRHDYRPKPFSRIEPFKPPGQLVTSDKPLDDLTTMLASYQPPRRVSQPVSFKPERYYKKPCDTMDDKTVHKMSYVPWPVKDKECMPWADKQKYRHPCQPMDGNTVYNTSYLAPGQMTEDCVSSEICCCPQPEPAGCYCNFPAECFNSPDSTSRHLERTLCIESNQKEARELSWMGYAEKNNRNCAKFNKTGTRVSENRSFLERLSHQ